VCASLGKLPLAALEFLLLHVNTLQNDVEYQFLPTSLSDPFLAQLAVGRKLPARHFEELAEDFVQRLNAQVTALSDAYHLQNDSGPDGALDSVAEQELARRSR
jgi:hypothetical protein